MDLCDRFQIELLLSRHGFHFSRSMGQNFLTDAQAIRDIAAASGADGSCGVLEIGPGIGTLTRELSRRAGRVVAVELDRALLPILAETLADCGGTEVISGDVMRLDLAALAAEHFSGLRPIVCANLPYNITTPVLTKLVQTPCFESVTVLIQREVARRLAAPPGSAEVGAFSLYLQYFMEAEALFDLPPELFVPAPRVTSAVLRCVRRARPAVEVEDEAWFFQVIRGAFFLRRKTLLNSLSAAMPALGRDAVRAAIGRAGLPENIRGERLGLPEFAALAKALQSG